MNEAAFLSALHETPDDEATWLALADWLEDDGQSARAELVRLTRRLRKVPVMRRTKERAALEARVIELLNAGTRPVVAEVTNSIGMRLALIPPGRFRMGSPRSEPGRIPDEFAHEARLTKPFYFGVFPITQAEFRRLTRRNPSFFCATGGGHNAVEGMDVADFPVERVRWSDAVAYCKKLSALKDEQKAKRTYRLPTEAEWEYACRGGSATTTAFHYGERLTVRDANVNSSPGEGDPDDDEPLRRTCPVGLYKPNVFGLYDMHGNVWQWCDDWHADDHYRERDGTDPRGPTRGTTRIIRGGSWGARWLHSRSARRHSCSPNDRIYGFGFRVVMTVGQ